MRSWAFFAWSRRPLAQGALALLDQPSFGIGSLPPIPAKVSGLTVMSIDLAKSYDLIDSLIKLVGPQGTAGLSNPVIMEQQGLDLRKDLLANLGPKLAFYTQSDIHGEPSSAAGLAASRAAGSTFSVQTSRPGSSGPCDRSAHEVVRPVHEAAVSFRRAGSAVG